MPIKRVMKGIQVKSLAEGILEHDNEALSPRQQECLTRFGMTYQMEQEAYLIIHPEVQAMLTSFIKKMVRMSKRKEILKEAIEYFTRPTEVIDAEIRDVLKVQQGPYKQSEKMIFRCDDEHLIKDLKQIDMKHFISKSQQESISSGSIENTVSSSFLSIITSNTTLPTPEPVPTPEPTLSETMLAIISNTVDKAIFLHVDDIALRYDTAYVELSKAVEEAMEIPVIEIRHDIAELFHKAYEWFEIDIMIKERKAAERAWENRMRKKLKRTLRQMNNFKGYETPPTPKSEPSSHESYKVPPPRPCLCHPQYNYNRYPKDRFGIYLPRESPGFSEYNVTVTPAISIESLNDEVLDKKSIRSKKSVISSKSATSKKCTFKSSIK